MSKGETTNEITIKNKDPFSPDKAWPLVQWSVTGGLVLRLSRSLWYSREWSGPLT